MKRNAIRSRPSPRHPIAWRDINYSQLRAGAADTFDDRISENIFDSEDERTEVDNIVHGMLRDAN